MDRNIHDIYDVIMKIIIDKWDTSFLHYINLKKEMKSSDNTEFVTTKGKHYFLDYLCEIEDGSFYDIEFEYPRVYPSELEKFYDYNTYVKVNKEANSETLVFNFTSQKEVNPCEIGESITFHPKQFFLGDVDFETIIQNINIKHNTDTKLTSHDEISLMLRCLVSDFKDKTSALKNISKILKKRYLFDEKRFEYLEAVIKLEIENLVPKQDQKEILKEYGGEIMMSHQTENTFTQALNAINKKVLYETEEKGRKKGIKKGMEEIIKKIKPYHTDEELSKITGISIEEIQKIQ